MVVEKGTLSRDGRHGLVQKDYNASIDTNSTSARYTWTAMLRTDGQELNVLKIITMTTKSDYAGNFGDEIAITCRIQGEEYKQFVYPNRQLLYLDIVFTQVLDEAASNKTSNIFSHTYRAILADPSNFDINDTLDEVVDVDFQLIDPILESQMRRKVSGIFYGGVDEVLSTLMSSSVETSKTTAKYSLAQVEQGVALTNAGVMIDPIDNTERTGPFVIKARTPLIELPDYMQLHYGVYNHGLGVYLHKGVWRIWPLYKKTGFDNARLAISLSNLNKRLIPSTDKSWSKDGGLIKIYATGDAEMLDLSESKLKSIGNGFRMQKADNIIDDFAVTSKHITTASKSYNVLETLIKQDDGGMNHAPYIRERASSNPYKAFSAINSLNGQMAEFQWQHSNPFILEPGLPAKISYQSGRETIQTEGRLMGAIHQFSTDSAMQLDDTVRCQSVLRFWME